jgi:tyrosine-protein kinase Etk/Wzc
LSPIISRASVSNSPAYPKKLPIVLIVTLATLMLATGTIVTGELLRMTIPRAAVAFRSPIAPVRAAATDGLVDAAERKPASDSFAVPLAPDVESEFDEVEQLAARLLAAGAAARKIMILGTASSQSITLTVLKTASCSSDQPLPRAKEIEPLIRGRKMPLIFEAAPDCLGLVKVGE